MSDEAARLQAFDIARKLALPVGARSWTARELRRNELRLFWLVVGLFVLVLGGMTLGAATDGGRQSRMVLPWLAGSGLLTTALVTWGSWRRFRKHAAYRDPLIRVEVAGAGVAVDWDGRRIELAWDEVDYLFYWQRLRSGTRFLGIQLKTPAGSLYINDQWFCGGRKAAAAIVTGQDKWRVLRRTG